MDKLSFGIYHTEYSMAGDKFFDFADSDFINCFLAEGDYNDEKFAITLNELKKHKGKKAWVGVARYGIKIETQTCVVDTGEEKETFKPVATLLPDYKERVDALIEKLKKEGWYDIVDGFYMDEPMLWGVTNDMLEEYTGYFRKVAAPDKRFFICFSVAGVAPEVWTINDIKPITPKSSQYLTDIAFDMYHKWSDDYYKILNLMKERTGHRKDLKLWMIPCVMNYRGDKTEEHCLEHLEKCYEVLKKDENPGGLMCYNYFTFPSETEDLGNIGLDKLTDPNYKNYWIKLYDRIKEIGREISKI